MHKTIWNIFYKWRFYALGREQYEECIAKIFSDNLNSLRLANRAVFTLAGCFAFFPIVVENDLLKACVYFTMAAVALLLAIFSGFKERQHSRGRPVSERLIYTLIIIYYINIMSFGIYLGVWSNPDRLAVTFITFLICSLFLMITPPMFNLCLTVCSTVLLVVSSVHVKAPEKWVFDLTNVIIAGSAALFFVWQINRLRMLAKLNASRLEEERNSYYSQCTVDELTQLRNRRDFTQTFQRYLTNYRSSDECLCTAIIDIDCFKEYNDHYGHPQGDKCLQLIGKALTGLAESAGVYVARVGGEEFAMLWFEKEDGLGKRILSETHRAIMDLNISHVKSKASQRVTVSMGIHIIKCGYCNDMDVIYKLADKSLYVAKRSGRNCTCVSGGGIRETIIIPN